VKVVSRAKESLGVTFSLTFAVLSAEPVTKVSVPLRRALGTIAIAVTGRVWPVNTQSRHDESGPHRPGYCQQHSKQGDAQPYDATTCRKAANRCNHTRTSDESGSGGGREVDGKIFFRSPLRVAHRLGGSSSHTTTDVSSDAVATLIPCCDPPTTPSPPPPSVQHVWRM
jgi:hypothetical protein